MAYQTIVDYNITGVDDILVYVASAFPSFIPIFLLAIFIIVAIGTFYGTRRSYGQGDFWASTTAASFLTTLIAILMTFKDGLINSYVLAIVIVVNVISLILLLFSRER